MQYYPYGEEITSTNNDTYKYAQTYRDSDSGLDYAMNRYYASGIGQFLTPDPFGKRSARPNSPRSWNRYSYAEGYPVNSSDPTGLFVAANPANFCWVDPIGEDSDASEINCMYPGSSFFSLYVNPVTVPKPTVNQIARVNIAATENQVGQLLSSGPCAGDYNAIGAALYTIGGNAAALAGGSGALSSLIANGEINPGTPSGNNPGQTTGYGSNVQVILNEVDFSSTMGSNVPGLLNFGSNSNLTSAQQTQLDRNLILLHELVHAMINMYAPVVAGSGHILFDLGLGQNKLAQDCLGYSIQQ
jgi:RHS repeat-associated protein